MLQFWNKGVIELDAITALGVSVKKPGAFGRFGTGLKFAIAAILRAGGKIKIYRGIELLEFSLEERMVSGQPFQFIKAGDKDMGITTLFGRDWKPWMVLRELGCNALDECGGFGHAYRVSEEGHTLIEVEWDELETAYKQRKDIFCDGEVLWENEQLRIRDGMSQHLFYRGVRVYKLAKPSNFTFDILAPMDLSEDRTLAHSWRADSLIRDALVQLPIQELAYTLLTTEERYETKLDFVEHASSIKPSQQFMKAIDDARDEQTLKSSSAFNLLLKHKREMRDKQYRESGQVLEDKLSAAIEWMSNHGMAFESEQMFVPVDELADSKQSLLEGKTVYLLQALLNGDIYFLVEQLIHRWVEIKLLDTYPMTSDVVATLVPVVMRKLAKPKDVKHAEPVAMAAAIPAVAWDEDDIPF